MKKKDETSRRAFLKTAALTGAGLGIAGSGAAVASNDAAAAPAAAPAAKVPRKTLGSTGEKVPILVLGCAQKFDDKYDKILHRCFKEGVDYLDTAHVYADGMSHKTIAPFLEQVDRKNVWITSKMPPGVRGKAPFDAEPGTPDFFAKGIGQCLTELQTDYLDLFFMHALDDPKYLEPEFLKMGDGLRKSKKTRFFGFSCHGARELELLNKAAKVGGIDVIMFRYSFAKYGDLELNKAIDACKKAGIGLIAMKTQDSVQKDFADVVKFQSQDFTLGQAKLKAVWADDRIDSAVSHMDNTNVLKENIAAAKSPVQISMNDFNQLQQLATATAAYSCHGCEHLCEPHVAGETKIADTLRFLMYHESYNEEAKARQLFRQMSTAQQQINGVDFTRAAAACPRGIDIQARMNLAQEKLVQLV
jgi:predicted aldo/keto reductase-like oxidoreductase